MTDAFFASDAFPLAIAALIVAEAAMLAIWMKRSGREARIPVMLAFLASGLAFASALYFHRRPNGTEGFAFSMCVAFAAHAATIVQLARHR